MSDHYFAPSPTAASRPGSVPLVLADITINLRTDAGVFSPERVDPGTKLLLAQAPPVDPDVRHILDLGCGYGPIAVATAMRAPSATVWAVDTNERAVNLCERNAHDAGVGDRVHALVVPDDDPLHGIGTEITFDLIWSNPPIRIGKPALHRLLLAALERLAPEGEALLVVHRHLGSDSLQRWLDDQGWPTLRVSSRQGYRLLQVRRSSAAPAPGQGSTG